MFNGPIPGQSLTLEPGNSPWEQPPLYPKVEQALAWHLKNFNNEERLDDLLFLLDQGMPISTFTESLTSGAVMNGFHTADVSTLLQPVLHEYFYNIAKAAGINCTEWGGPSQEEKDAEKYKQRFGIVLQNKLSGMKPQENRTPLDPIQQEPVAPPTAGTNGLVPRRV